MSKRASLLFGVLFTVFFSVAGLLGAEELVTTEAIVDFAAGELRISLFVSYDVPSRFSPSTIYRLEQRTLSVLPDLIRDSARSLQVDSRLTFGERIDASWDVAEAWRLLVSRSRPAEIRPGRDLRSVSVELRLPLFPDLAAVLPPTASGPITPMRTVGWVPDEAYTGLVIYADGPLPRYGGGDDTVEIRPALYPRVHTEEGDVLVSADMIDDAVLRHWGVAAYSESTDEAPFVDRIGRNPLRVEASSVFGIAPTDPVVPQTTAMRLTRREENRRLIAEGRILVVVPPGAAAQTAGATTQTAGAAAQPGE